jgi:hypothetical protein
MIYYHVSDKFDRLQLFAGFQVISVNHQITSKKKIMNAMKQARTIIFLLVAFFIAQRICSSLKSDTNAECNQNDISDNPESGILYP